MIVTFVGLPGAGKSNLARLIGPELRLPVALEAVNDNVFLRFHRFAGSPMTLENSVFFLLDYMAAVYRYRDGFVYDSSVELDCAYARATLSAADCKLVEEVGARFAAAAPADLVVHLEASPDLVRRRLAERDSRHPLLESDWMERLDREVAEVFASSGAARKVRVQADWASLSAVLSDLRAALSS